jgi:hypothetical protein
VLRSRLPCIVGRDETQRRGHLVGIRRPQTKKYPDEEGITRKRSRPTVPCIYSIGSGAGY